MDVLPRCHAEARARPGRGSAVVADEAMGQVASVIASINDYRLRIAAAVEEERTTVPGSDPDAGSADGRQHPSRSGTYPP